MALEAGAEAARIPAFKKLCLQAVETVAAGRPGYGLLCDERQGRDALYAAAGQGLWIGRPVEVPGSRPLELELGSDLGTDLAEWASEHVVKVLCFYHPDDDAAIKARQEETIGRLFDAARSNDLEFLLEIIPSKVADVDDETTARAMQRFYDLGVRPDWWKLEPMRNEAAWAHVTTVIERCDPWCRGILVLGLEASEEELAASFAVAASHPRVRGFAVGRTIFSTAAMAWLRGEMDDAAAVDDMAARYRALCDIWDRQRPGPAGETKSGAKGL